MSGSTPGRWLPWLNQWGWPFVWILLIPIATVFWSAVLLDQVLDEGICAFVEPPFGREVLFDEWRCRREDVLPTLLPGLLNLVAFSWVLSGQREVRWAALVAGTLGAVRLAAPLLIYRLSGAYVDIGDFRPITVSGPASSVLLSWGLWGLSAVSAIGFLVGANVVESKKRKGATTGKQAPVQEQCKNCRKRLTVNDKMRNRGTGLCWECFGLPQNSNRT